MTRYSLIILATLLLSSCKNSHKNIDNSRNIENGLLAKKEDTLQSVQLVDTAEIIKKNRRAGEYWFLSSDSLYGNDLLYIPPSELRIMRNEIFARYGYKFKSNDLLDYFMKQKWYKPLFQNVDTFLNSTEKHNINFIKQYENKNEEIGKENVFDTFIDYVKNNKVAPRMLSYKFGEEYSFSFGDPAPTFSAYKQVFQNEKTAKYLLFSLFAGCSDCEYEISINKYSNQGKMMDTYHLGYTNERNNVFMLNDSVLKCIMTSFNSEKQQLDTTIKLLKVNNQGKIIEVK